MWLQMHNMQE